MLPHASKKKGESGSAMVEFCLCCVVIMPLLLGLCGGGVALIRQLELTQLARDTGHMLANGVDFNQPNYEALVYRLSGSLSFGPPENKPPGGLYLSTVNYIIQSDCDANKLPKCANVNQYVITRQIVIGSPGPSSIGYAYSPDSTGAVKPADYLNNSRARATAISPAISNLWNTYSQNQHVAFISEAFVQNKDLLWSGTVSEWASAWAIF